MNTRFVGLMGNTAHRIANFALINTSVQDMRETIQRMRIRLSNKLYIEDAPKWLIDWCFYNLIVKNPDFYKKERMGKWTGNTPREIVLYEKNGNALILPFGIWSKDFYNQVKAETESITSNITAFKPINYQSSINLYDYQERAVKEALNARNGIIVMPCGAGKTQTAIELIARLGGRTLWLTHTGDLLNQSMNRAKDCLDVDKDTYGKITEGKVNIGTGITFATVQTMAKIDLTPYKHEWDVIVVDECHKAIGSPTKVMQFYKVVSSLACRYKFGLTATPERSDGLHKSMLALLGNIIITIPKEAVADTTCPVNVRYIDTGYAPSEDAFGTDGTLEYVDLVDDLTHDEARFKCVFDTIKGLKSCLVLANRVEYLERLMKAYNETGGNAICLSTLGTSKKAKETRKESLKQLNAGNLDCIFATYQLACEGLDVPSLKYVVLATPEKDERIVTQAVGRVGRKAEGKAYGTVIDVRDDTLEGWASLRRRYYKKLGYDIY